MAQLAEAIGAVGRWLVVGAVKHRAVVVVIVVVDEVWRWACGTGVRKSIRSRFLEFKIKGFPFLKEGGSRCRVLLRSRTEEVKAVIVIEYGVDDSGGFRFLLRSGRDSA